ncbi:MAG TPA: PorP/SprF family type IX secretion system membrane protein [Bacteroidia bacterium]|nr:PorP/SprF family type IX secretion system membrane protein [Bacteroidia bacterium]
MKYFKFLLFFSMILSSLGYGQDVHFTQFYTAPLTINPSMTGDYSGDYRFMNTFRSQWRKFDPGYVSNSLGFDQQFYLLNEKMSGGINMVYDKSGINAMQIAKINLSFAWHKTISKNVFHFGLQGGYILKSYDVSKLTFPDQFNQNNGYFDASLATADGDLNDNTSYFDLNAGIGWNRKIKKHTPKIGFALFHINRPDESFTGTENKLPSRYVVTLSDKWEATDRLIVTPQILYMEQVKANDFMAGVLFTRKSKEPESKIGSISYGAFWRNSINSKTDAVALVAGFKYDLFDIGFSYDVNVSEAKTVTNYKGAFEISIIYTALNTRAVKVKIPCERY